MSTQDSGVLQVGSYSSYRQIARRSEGPSRNFYGDPTDVGRPRPITWGFEGVIARWRSPCELELANGHAVIASGIAWLSLDDESMLAPMRRHPAALRPTRRGWTFSLPPQLVEFS